MNKPTSMQRIEAATFAALHSLWITGTAVAGALLFGAQSVGALDTPEHLWAYIRANAFQCAATVVLAPLIRAGMAAKKGTS